jgi:hypothetical protein
MSPRILSSRWEKKENAANVSIVLYSFHRCRRILNYPSKKKDTIL